MQSSIKALAHFPVCGPSINYYIYTDEQ